MIMFLESLLLNSSVTITLTSYCLVPNAKDKEKKKKRAIESKKKKKKWLGLISMESEPWMFSG